MALKSSDDTQTFEANDHLRAADLITIGKAVAELITDRKIHPDDAVRGLNDLATAFNTRGGKVTALSIKPGER